MRFFENIARTDVVFGESAQGFRESAVCFCENESWAGEGLQTEWRIRICTILNLLKVFTSNAPYGIVIMYHCMRATRAWRR